MGATEASRCMRGVIRSREQRALAGDTWGPTSPPDGGMGGAPREEGREEGQQEVDRGGRPLRTGTGSIQGEQGHRRP